MPILEMTKLQVILAKEINKHTKLTIRDSFTAVVIYYEKFNLEITFLFNNLKEI